MGFSDSVWGSRDVGIPGTLFTGMLLVNLFYWCANQAIVQHTLGAKNPALAQFGI